MVDLERTIEPRTPSYLRKYIVKLFRLYRRLCADYIDYKVEYPKGHVSCWPDLVIKSTVEPKRCLILDVRESSLEVIAVYQEIVTIFRFRCRVVSTELFSPIVVVTSARVQLCAKSYRHTGRV